MKWIEMSYIKGASYLARYARGSFYDMDNKILDKFQAIFFENVKLPVTKLGLEIILKMLEKYEEWNDIQFIEAAKDFCYWCIRIIDKHPDFEGGFWTIRINERTIENNE